MTGILPAQLNPYERILLRLGESDKAQASLEQRLNQKVNLQYVCTLKTRYGGTTHWQAAKDCIKAKNKKELDPKQQEALSELFRSKFPQVWARYPRLGQLAVFPISSPPSINTQLTSQATLEREDFQKEIWKCVARFLEVKDLLRLFTTCRLLYSLKETEVWKNPSVQREALAIIHTLDSWHHFPFSVFGDSRIFLTNELIIAADRAGEFQIRNIKSGQVLNTIPFLTSCYTDPLCTIDLSPCGHFLVVENPHLYEIFDVELLRTEKRPEPLISSEKPVTWCLCGNALLKVANSTQIMRQKLKSLGEEELFLDLSKSSNYSGKGKISFHLDGRYILAQEQQDPFLNAHWWCSVTGRKIASLQLPETTTLFVAEESGQIQSSSKAWSLIDGNETAPIVTANIMLAHLPQVRGFLMKRKAHPANQNSLQSSSAYGPATASSPNGRWLALRVGETQMMPDGRRQSMPPKIYIIDFGIG